jgi:integrase
LQKTPSSRDKELTLHTNTISKQFDIFKSLYNKGRIELKEEGLSIINNPFEDFTYETINTNKEKLTLDEINRMNALELQENSSLWHTRNCFMFAFYCAGMRAGDLIQLRGTNIIYNNNEWRISYRMDKTSVAKEILLLPQATEILKHYVDFNQLTPKYIFPLLDNDAIYSKAITWEMKERLPFETKAYLLRQVNSKNSLLNKNLAKLAELAEIEKKVTMHIARHSFANIARQKNANLYDISKSLGHSSLKITETYLSNFDTESQDKTMKQVFNEPITEEMKKEQLIEQLKQLSSDKLAELLKRIE